MTAPEYPELFLEIESSLKENHEKKEKIQKVVQILDNTAHKMENLLQPIHRLSNQTSIEQITKSCRELLPEIKSTYKQLVDVIPEDLKYANLWQNETRKLCYLVSLIVFLESNQLAHKTEIVELLGFDMLLLDDYLFGLLLLASELSRLAVNSVTNGDFCRPLQISAFVSELESGFRLLNFKNDFLRRKFDGLKYDVKKIEQVVYDLKLHGLSE